MIISSFPLGVHYSITNLSHINFYGLVSFPSQLITEFSIFFKVCDFHFSSFLHCVDYCSSYSWFFEHIGEKRTFPNNILYLSQLNWTYSKNILPFSWCQWMTDDRSKRNRKKNNENPYGQKKYIYWGLKKEVDALKVGKAGYFMDIRIKYKLSSTSALTC